MRNTLMIGALAAAFTLPLLAMPQTADAASCGSRKTTGTILGGVGGALLGGAVTHGSAGPIIGGVGGAVVGHQIGKDGCKRTYRTTSYRAPARAAAPAPQPARYVYYDQYGRPVTAGSGPTRVNYAASCRTETRSYYDDRGRLVRGPMQICDR